MVRSAALSALVVLAAGGGWIALGLVMERALGSAAAWRLAKPLLALAAGTAFALGVVAW